MRLLLTGDVHIGRSSSRIPSSVRRDDLRAATAWIRIVDVAIEEGVDVVCLSGDVADKENRFWEAVGPLEAGVNRLGEAGILTLAVSGNHDFDVLARLADQLPQDRFRLLGRGGTWERLTIERDGKAILHVDGWSFPREHVFESPAGSYDLAPDAHVPILGLVHGDLDVANSIYAPLERNRLFALPPACWALGHVHAPRLLTGAGDAWILYPGSPQALDFGEPGVHGPWIVDVDHGLGRPEQRPLSTVRYEDVSVDLGGSESETDVETAILRGLREATDVFAEESGSVLRFLALRLRATGRTCMSHRVSDVTERLVHDLALTAGQALVTVDRMRIETLPEIDVEEYARLHSAPGVLARVLLDLDEPEPSPDVAELIARTRTELRRVYDHRHFAGLRNRDVTDEMARDVLREQSSALLTQLVAQTS